jgi:cellobiose epimerase
MRTHVGIISQSGCTLIEFTMIKNYVLLSIVLLLSGTFSCAVRQGYPSEEKQLLIQLRNEIEDDLNNNLLPFWKNNSVDRNDPDEGFFGAITNEGTGVADATRHNVLFTRYLWTYSTAYRIFGDMESLELAHRAFNYLVNQFWDNENGGVYWQLNSDGTVSDPNKMTYGLAFAIYAFSEYYRITENELSLDLAIQIFNLLEKHAYDPVYGGYLEAFTADWEYVPGQGMASGRSKSMNTHLHMLEAYTNLYRVWPDKLLEQKMHELIDVFWNHILNTGTWHQELYFERDWTVYGRYDSYGHDIEFSWLFDEAGKVLGNSELIRKIQDASVKIAEIQLNEGMNADGAMIYEKIGEDRYRDNISWWVQAEAVVGFINAYEISRDRKYLDAAIGVWDYIKKNMIDREYGGWFANLDAKGTPRPNARKGDGWTCPYHNGRMGFEIYERLHHLD